MRAHFRTIACAVLWLVAACVPVAAATAQRGWLEPPTAGAASPPLPAGVRPLLDSGAQRFVEATHEAAARLQDAGWTFRPVEEAFQLAVGGAGLDVRYGPPAIPEAWRSPPPGPGRRPYLVKFDAPVQASWPEDLRRAGAEPVQYLPSFGYLVLLSPGGERAVSRLDHVEFQGEYHPFYRADEPLRALATAGGPAITLRLVLLDLPGWEAALAEAEARGGHLAHRSDLPATSGRHLLHYAILESVAPESLPDLLAHPAVYRAERWWPPIPEGERAAQITAGNLVGPHPAPDYYAWLASLGADGTGVTVAVADTGLDTGDTATLHPDVLGRVTFATALCTSNADPSGHGTNVASIAVGDPRAASGGTGLLDAGGFHWGGGSAPGASLHFQTALGGGCPAYNADAASLAAEAVILGGAQLGSHSFTDGLGGGGGYNSQAQAWDALVRDADITTAGNQPYGVYFSAGNSGPGSGSLTSPKAAKNMVTVGATENDRPGECPGLPGCAGAADDIDEIVSFSSRGPTNDGRIKPDVVAPGHVIAGMRSSVASYSCTCDGGGGTGCCDSLTVDGTLSYSRYSGTSQASPRVAGAAAVIYDWYQGLHGAFPSPAMAKAILVNGALDLKSPDVPNMNEGWGRVALRPVLQAEEGVTLVDQAVVLGATGDAAAYTTSLFVQDPTRPLKATLVWTDPPGAINCNPCLVNDLDLLVTQGASTWRGNNFVAGASVTGGSPDTRNNVEGVLLTAGAATCSPALSVKVRAQTLAGDGVPGNADATDQDFALVVRNAGTSPGPPTVVTPAAAAGGGCDADVFLDRNETVDLTITLENAGCSDALGVTAEVIPLAAPPGASVGVAPTGPQPVGDIAAGASVPGVWQVSLADHPSGFCGEQLLLEVQVADGQGRSWTRTVGVRLDADGFTPSADLDDATTDGSFARDGEWSLRACRTTSPPTSWHLGQADCTGLVRDGADHPLEFRYALGPGDQLQSLSFQHAFDGYNNGTLRDTATVEIDHDADGIFTTLQTWTDGIDNPASMTLAGPYSLTAFNEGRAATVAVRFRFQSAANWVGPNSAPGWDVDDIALSFDAVQCDAEPCPGCAPAPDPVPDGGGGSTPLLVDLLGGMLQLSWGAVDGAASYNLYTGSLGDWYSHDRFAATGLDGADSCAEPGTSASFAPPAGSAYFLAAADNGCAEGDYGFDSGGTPIPRAPTACSGP